MRRRVLVTGCTGMVGHGICQSLLDLGHEVWGTARSPLRPRHPGFNAMRLELERPQDFSALLNALPPLDAVIHAAAKLPQNGPLSWEDEQEYFRLNFDATRHLLRVCADRHSGMFILISSMGGLDAEYQHLAECAPFKPTNAYHCSKAAAEIAAAQFAAQNRLRTITLRISAPYGYVGRDLAVIPRFIALARRGAPLPLWGKGERSQMFTFVEDIGLACDAAMRTKDSGTFHITGPESTSMRQLAEEVLRACPGTGSSIVFTGEPDPLEGAQPRIGTDKAKKILGFSPRYTLSQGLARITAATPQAMCFAKDPT